MIPVVDVATMRQSDFDTIAGGTSGRELMMRAGEGIFQSYRWQGRTAIVCGSGNNAGDGYVLAILMTRKGYLCDIILLSDRFSEDGNYYFEQCRAMGITTLTAADAIDFSLYTQIVDCIFGTGFYGTPHGLVAEVIKAINQSGKPVISADINSGLHGDSGMGECCVRSDLTVAIGSYKPGHFIGQAKDVIGRLTCVDIGIKVPQEHILVPEQEDIAPLFAPRAQNSHKGNYGYVAVMGGCIEYSGAAKLANMSASALRAGCGVVTLAVPQSIVGSVSPYLLESTLLPVPSDEQGHMLLCKEQLDQLLSRYAAIAIGMGWGRGAANAEILSYLLKSGQLPLIIDADGLNALAEMDLSLLQSTKCRVILTPHLKEFERLCGLPIGEIQKDPVAHAEAFAKEYGVCLLLKGCCTVVTDGNVTYLCNRGCAGMATAGSGDVLSGILAGLCGYLTPNALTVAAGAYLAGRAGELAEQSQNAISMVASDTVRHIAAAVSELI